MAINAIVDGVTYSGIDTIQTGGKNIALEADAGANYGPSLLNGTIQELNDDSVIYLRASALTNLPSLTSVNFPALQTMGSYAFAYCIKLKTVNLGGLSIISDYAFTNCSQLESLSAESVTLVGGFAFARCQNLTDVSMPLLQSAYDSAFQLCGLNSVYFPLLIKLSSTAFFSCSMLSFVSLPMLSSIENMTFARCSELAEAKFTEVSNIMGSAFQSCVKLTRLELGFSSIVNLSTSSAFNSTPIAGYTASTGGQLGSIYVPASLLTAYQSATNWAFFSERFVGV